VNRTIIAGPYDGTLGAAVEGHVIDGLVEESTYLWGLFRSASSDPDVFQVMRRLSSEPAWPARLLLQTNTSADGMRPLQTARTAARSADARHPQATAGPGWIAGPTDDAEPLLFTVDGGHVHWLEGDILDLEGEEVTPGLQWCLLPTAEGMRYASRIFRVAGHVDAVPVDGFVGMDVVHLQSGKRNYLDDPITAHRLSSAWCTWAAEWEDGQIEAGHASFGPNGFGFAVRADGRIAHVATNVTGTATTDDHGCPTHITFELQGPSGSEAWEFIADPRALPLEPLPGPVRQAEGLFRRVGDTRRPITWCATAEIPACSPRP